MKLGQSHQTCSADHHCIKDTALGFSILHSDSSTGGARVRERIKEVSTVSPGTTGLELEPMDAESAVLNKKVKNQRLLGKIDANKLTPLDEKAQLPTMFEIFAFCTRVSSGQDRTDSQRFTRSGLHGQCSAAYRGNKEQKPA